MKEIPLSKGKVALVDDEDYAYLSQFKWRWSDHTYARRNGRRPPGIKIQPQFIMHREITGAKKGEFVDHIDGNPLNNTRANLRIVTHSQKSARKTRVAKRGSLLSAPFKGVMKTKQGKYSANICKKSLGVYDTAEEAAKAYDKAALERWGFLAAPNFPQEDT